MLKINQLRHEAYQTWETNLYVLGLYNPAPESIGLPKAEAESLPYTNQAFKNEVRKRFGDLKRRSTWEQAAIWFTAQGMAQSYLEPYQIVGYMVSPDYMNAPIRQHYGEQVIEAMLQFSEVIDIIKDGLEQIYQDSFYRQERQLVEQFIREGHQFPVAIPLPSVA
jgi:hypothetical protein